MEALQKIARPVTATIVLVKCRKLSVMSIKKFIKSLQLKALGMQGSIE